MPKSLGLKSLGLKSLGLKSLGLKSLGLKLTVSMMLPTLYKGLPVLTVYQACCMHKDSWVNVLQVKQGILCYHGDTNCDISKKQEKLCETNHRENRFQIFKRSNSQK